MAIPILPKLQLPSDIMARIAAARERGQLAQRQQQAFPLEQQQRQQLLQQRAQQIAQQQQAFPLMQQLRQQQVPLAQARTASLQTQVQSQPIRDALIKAQTQAALKKAQDPFGGIILPGTAGASQALQILAERVGTDSPIYKRALAGYNSKVKLQNSRADYYSANVALKNLPLLQKKQIASNYQNFNAKRQQQGLPAIGFQDWLDSAGANLVPANKKVTAEDTVNHTPVSTVGAEPLENQALPHPEGSPPVIHQLAQQSQNNGDALTKEQATLTPEDFKSENKQTQLAIAKAAGDPKIFQKWVNWGNTLRIMQDVNPTILERYTGPGGLGRISRDRALELAGTKVPGFDEYNNFVNVTVPVVSDKLRQAWGTSIDPKIMDMLKRVSNPISWKNSPDLALSQWDQLLKLARDQHTALRRYVALSSRTTSSQDSQQPSGAAGPTDEDIEFTARQKGLTVDQVRQRLGKK